VVATVMHIGLENHESVSGRGLGATHHGLVGIAHVLLSWGRRLAVSYVACWGLCSPTLVVRGTSPAGPRPNDLDSRHGDPTVPGGIVDAAFVTLTNPESKTHVRDDRI